MPFPPVTKALIPCGGKGTRMLALTHGAPKELIPVGGVPVLDRVAAECAASGIEEVLVITAPGKEEIERHLAPLAGTPGMPRRFDFAVQIDPRGLADAIRLGSEFAGNEPLAVALPDNLFIGNVPGLREVIDTYEATGMSVVAMVEIFADEAGRRGPTALYEGRVEGDLFRIARIPDKGEKGKTFDLRGAASAFTGVGRYVFTPDVWPAIDEVEHALPLGAELDDVPVMQRLLASGRMIGRVMRARFLDVGLPSGYAEANAHFGAAH